MIAFNFTSRVVNEIVIQQPNNGAYAYAVNFKMAVTLCKEFLNDPAMTGEQVMREISRHTIPLRPGRQDERKLRAKGFGVVHLPRLRHKGQISKNGGRRSIPPPPVRIFF